MNIFDLQREKESRRLVNEISNINVSTVKPSIVNVAEIFTPCVKHNGEIFLNSKTYSTYNPVKLSDKAKLAHATIQIASNFAEMLLNYNFADYLNEQPRFYQFEKTNFYTEIKNSLDMTVKVFPLYASDINYFTNGVIKIILSMCENLNNILELRNKLLTLLFKMKKENPNNVSQITKLTLFINDFAYICNDAKQLLSIFNDILLSIDCFYEREIAMIPKEQSKYGKKGTKYSHIKPFDMKGLMSLQDAKARKKVTNGVSPQ